MIDCNDHCELYGSTMRAESGKFRIGDSTLLSDEPSSLGEDRGSR
jgi:hypothetical protein